MPGKGPRAALGVAWRWLVGRARRAREVRGAIRTVAGNLVTEERGSELPVRVLPAELCRAEP
jgi:hypothetical protein